MLKNVIIRLIKAYQATHVFRLPVCRYYPSCSHYTLEAVEKYGVWRGTLKGLLRIGRCHPFHPGGYDPVE